MPITKESTLQEKWQRITEKTEFAYQPIVASHSGNIFGFEALLRNVPAAGFATIDALFDTACEENIIYYTDLLLREKAISGFCALKSGDEKLFYNLDSRVINMPDYKKENTQAFYTPMMTLMDNPCDKTKKLFITIF